LSAARTNLSAVLAAESRSDARTPGQAPDACEHSDCAVARLAGAGLFVRTLTNLERLDVGFETGHLALFELNPQLGGYDDSRVRLC
jgi:hypothetical protein